MNAHLLCHLTKYVRLWGPLWTHSSFGFESYNGHIKYLFHSRSSILDQLVFNIDIYQTLQLLHPHLVELESAQTLEFLDSLNGKGLQRDMTRTSEHSYIIGKTATKCLTIEESRAVGIPIGNIQIFTRLNHHGAIYHSSHYKKGAGKRNNQTCYFKVDCQKFGHLQYFVLYPWPVAVVKIFELTGNTFFGRAGQSCHRILEDY